LDDDHFVTITPVIALDDFWQTPLTGTACRVEVDLAVKSRYARWAHCSMITHGVLPIVPFANADNRALAADANEAQVRAAVVEMMTAKGYVEEVE